MYYSADQVCAQFFRNRRNCIATMHAALSVLRGYNPHFKDYLQPFDFHQNFQARNVLVYQVDRDVFLRDALEAAGLLRLVVSGDCDGNYESSHQFAYAQMRVT